MAMFFVPKLQLFLDIDQTLAHTPYRTEVVSPSVEAFFLKYGKILSVGYRVDERDFVEPYYIFPGVKELMYLLFLVLHDEIDVHFFSAGIDARNQALVEVLLTETLGRSIYNSIKSKVSIFSRKHTVDVSYDAIEAQYHAFGVAGADNKRKDMCVHQSGRLIAHSILVDDRPENIYPGQEDKFLCSPKATLAAYQALENEGFLPSFLLNPIYRQVNSVFYVVGLLVGCISVREENALEGYLFEWQFKKRATSTSKEAAKFRPCFDTPQQEEMFYESGLTCLQEINPRLTLNTPMSFFVCQREAGLASNAHLSHLGGGPS